MRFSIELAGISISVSAMCSETAEKYAEYLTDAPARFSVEVTPDRIEEERERTAGFAERQSWKLLSSLDVLDDQSVFHQISERLPECDALLFHGSALAFEGNGYLFAGASGIGKSTHTRIWREYFGERVAMINDDHPIIRCGENEILVGGSPWKGKHNLGSSRTAPLKGICFLKQSPVNRIVPLERGEGYSLVLRQCYPNVQAEHAVRRMELADRIANGVPLYRLECNMDPEAARVACEGMRAGILEEFK